MLASRIVPIECSYDEGKWLEIFQLFSNIFCILSLWKTTQASCDTILSLTITRLVDNSSKLRLIKIALYDIL